MIRVRMDKIPLLDRKEDLCELRNVKANTDDNFFRIPIEVSEVETCLIYPPVSISTSLLLDPRFFL